MDPELKEWLISDPKDKYVAMCKVCDTKFRNSNKTALLVHKESQKHQKNFSAKKLLLTPSDRPQDKVSKAELLLTAFMAEHQVPFRQADHLVETIKKMFPDSTTAQSMSLKRTKVSYLLQQGIAREERLAVANICKKQQFSLIIDESTDVSVSQILAVVVRYFDENQRESTDALLDTIEVDDATGVGLYNAVKQLLSERGIPLTNIIAFASDNCSTMMGAHSGFQAQLKKDVPAVFVLGCICHSFALCANHAASKLPSWLEAFLKDVCCYFSRSSKRQHEFQLIQNVVGAPAHRMLKLSQTRWLSRGEVIARVLEQWNALTLFFQSQSSTDKVDGAAHIYNTMMTPGTRHMLLFLNYVLAKVDAMNVEFQSEQFRLSKVFTTISCEYRSILGMFIKDDVIGLVKLSDIDPANPSLYKPCKELHVGGRCEAMLLKQSLGEKEQRFRLDCLAFLVELCQQMKKRFPFQDDSVLAQLCILDPKVATSTERQVKSIAYLAVKFPSLVEEEHLDELQDQWRALLYAKEALTNLVNLKPSSFWYELRFLKDGNGQPKCCLLSYFMCGLLALPHSSACVERVFSQVNLVKTKQTNRLQASTVANRLLAKQAISRQNAVCYTWDPSKSLIDDVKQGCCHQRYLQTLEKDKITAIMSDTDALDDDSFLMTSQD